MTVVRELLQAVHSPAEAGTCVVPVLRVLVQALCSLAKAGTFVGV